MAELVDAPDSKSGHFGGVGSIPSTPTNSMHIIKSIYKNKINNNFLNIIDEELILKDPHLKRSTNLWGENLHKKNKNIPEGFRKTFEYGDGIETHIEKVFNEFKIETKLNNYLEIGCGSGIDLRYIIKNYKFKNFFAIDIGKNIYDLSLLQPFKNIFFCRCSCDNLPFIDNSFDLIYSYGVFHHTKDFKDSILEAKRVLNSGGKLIFYNYMKHKNFFKRIGIFIENILLDLFRNLSFKQVKFICYFIAPIVLFIFSYPAQLLKFFGSKSVYKRLPLWWGKTPFNIIGDLTDRLYAPINKRLSKKEMITFLEENKFTNIEVKEVRDGLFCMVSK